MKQSPGVRYSAIIHTKLLSEFKIPQTSVINIEENADKIDYSSKLEVQLHLQ